jgi:hypothetical protein
VSRECIPGIGAGWGHDDPLFPVVAPRCLEATMGFEPMIRVLQDPTAAKRNLARLWPDSV